MNSKIMLIDLTQENVSKSSMDIAVKVKKFQDTLEELKVLKKKEEKLKEMFRKLDFETFIIKSDEYGLITLKVNKKEYERKTLNKDLLLENLKQHMDEKQAQEIIDKSYKVTNTSMITFGFGDK